jgi:tryptophanyl-tRNA synthetase
MIELAREIARTFNRIYGEAFVVPEAKVGGAGRLRGLDNGAKMGKSLDNAVFLKDDEAEVRRKIMGAYTDALKTRAHDPGRPDQCVVFSYHALFPGRAAAVIREECLKGERGCVQCKKELHVVLAGFLAPLQEKRRALENNLDFVRDVIRRGTAAGRAVTGSVLAKAKKVMRIDYEDILGGA